MGLGVYPATVKESSFYTYLCDLIASYPRLCKGMSRLGISFNKEDIVFVMSKVTPKVLGNKNAHRLSKKAIEPENTIQLTPAVISISIRRRKIGESQSKCQKNCYTIKVERFTKFLNKVLLGSHICLSYNEKVKLYASVSYSLRLGYNLVE